MFNPHIPPPPMETILHPEGGIVHPLLLLTGQPSMMQYQGVYQASQMYYNGYPQNGLGLGLQYPMYAITQCKYAPQQFIVQYFKVMPWLPNPLLIFT